MAGFTFKYRLGGGAPNVRNIISSDAALAVGDMVSLESQKLDLAVTNDSALLGVVLGPEDADNGADGVLTLVANTDKARVIIDEDAVYAVADANARKVGDLLDITGGTGAMGVGTPTNNDLIVVADSTATQPTLVKITRANHALAV